MWGRVYSSVDNFGWIAIRFGKGSLEIVELAFKVNTAYGVGSSAKGGDHASFNLWGEERDFLSYFICYIKTL